MKTYFGLWITIALLLINAGFLHEALGDDSQQTQPTVPPPTPFAVTVQDGNSRVWERTVYELAPDGTTVPKKHSYTELATGLNHLVNGQWVESSEEIDIQANGTASATQGQHQAYFPGDIYQGQIELVTPDGVHLQSRPMGLSYFDGTNSVLIAELTNSIGQVLGTNQVIYQNAFTDFAADIVYTYTKAGLEQDIVLREQPPTPESFGLNSQNTRLQVLTEFFNTADPVQSALPTNPQDGLTDNALTFGAMKMVQGRAFAIGDLAPTSPHTRKIPVYKSWQILDGRTFLVEEVPVQNIGAQLQQLPLPAIAGTTLNSANPVLHKVSTTRLLPPIRLVQAGTNTVQLARVQLNRKSGLVLDYVTINSDQTNITFQGDTTYYVNSGLYLYGTTTIEGGAVIKLNNGSIFIDSAGTLNCETAPYRPAIFTSFNNDSVGEAIPGSSGNPSGLTDGSEINIEIPTATVHDVHFLYLGNGLNVDGGGTSLDYWNCQFIEVDQVNPWSLSHLGLHNVLITQWPDADAAVYVGSGGELICENVTVDNANVFIVASGATIALTNCIITRADLIYTYVSNTVYTNSTFLIPSPSVPIFQTVGGGHYYLTNGSPYRNYGTTNISPALLADLRQKTTYPPIVYTNSTFSVATNFSPQAQRDTNAAPDLGYHYDPLDYGFGGCTTVSNLTFTAGTAVGWFRTSSGWEHAGYGIYLQEYVLAAFNGTATAPCYWVRLNTVQDQDNSGGYGPGGMDGEYNPGSNDTSTSPVAQLNFTRCSMMSYDGNHFRDDYGYLIVNAANSEFWGGGLGGYIILGNLTNCLLDRCPFSIQGDNNGARSLTMRNCLMRGTYLHVSHWSGATWPVSIINSAFDGTDLSGVDTNHLYCDYNAFLTNANRLPMHGTHDVTNVISFNWQSSWFGNFYQPTNSPLLNMGSTTADRVGLYHYTVTTNGVAEGTNTVSMGYHYVATDSNGNPLDFDGDGIPDYLEDSDGNGLVDSGDASDWTDYYNGTLPGLVIISGNNQGGPLNAFLPQALIVQATNSLGMVLTNAPLTFTVTNGLNQLAASSNGTTSTSLSLRTDASGYGTVWLFLPTNAPVTNVVMVTAVSGTNAVSAMFVETEGHVATPVISPGGNSFATYQNVTITCSTTNAVIYYTLDGSNPTETNSVMTNGQSIFVPTALTVKAAAFEDGILLPSAIQTANFTITGAIAAGRKHTLALRYDGTLLAGGSGGNGQIGDGTTHLRTNLVSVVGVSNVVGIAAGELFSYAWKADGTAWALACGDNRSGQMGNGTVLHRQTNAMQITNLTAVIAMAGGNHHGLAVETNGTVWAWGLNSNGQLGDGTITNRLVPVQVTNLTSVIVVAGGGAHSLALKSNGTVWAWGHASSGQLGDGTHPTLRTIPVQTVGLTNITAIAAGNLFSLALSNGIVWAWGDNGSGDLGDGTTLQRNTPVQVGGLSNVVAIAAAFYHGLALKSDGTVWSWGNNSAGQLGDCTTTYRTQPVQVNGVSNVVAIAAGGQHSVALKSDGTIVTWGYNNYGQEVIYSSCPVTQEPSVHLIWSPPFIINQPQSQNVVQGQNATFSVGLLGIGPFTYRWQLNGTNISGATGSSYTKLVVQISDAGNYSVVVSNTTASVTSSIAVLSVTIPLALTSSPANQTVLQGTNVSFTVGVSGNYLVYQWYYANGVALNNGVRITGATGSTLTLSNVAGSDATGYYAVVTNLFGSVTSASATLTVITNPAVSSPPTNTTAIQSDDVTFSVAATGFGLGYQWWLTNSLGTNAIPGATATNYTKLVVQTNDAGYYSVVITNAAGRTNVNADLTVLVPPWIVQQPSNVVTNQGSNATFSVTAIGTTNLIYQWFKFGTNAIAGATGSSFTLTNVQATDAAGYSVLVTNVAGTNFSAWAWLSVNLTGVGITNGWGGSLPSVVPTVSIISPTNAVATNPAIFPYGPPISIRATASSLYGYITNTAFYFTGTNYGTNFVLAGTAVPGANTKFALAWTNSLHGTNILRAVAWDNSGLTSTSSVVYVIMDLAPQVSTVPASLSLVWEGFATNVWFTNDVSDDGLPYGLTNISWSVPSGVTVSNFSTYTGTNIIVVTEATFTNSGNYDLTLNASDGFAPGSGTCHVTVKHRPVIYFNSPSNNAVSVTGIPLVLNATAYDPDGTIASVQFYSNSVSLGTGIQSVNDAYTFLWNNAPLWTNIVTAVATVNDGLTSSTNLTVVTVPPLAAWFISPTNGQLFVISPTNVILTANIISYVGATVTGVVFSNQTQSINLGMGMLSTNSNYQLMWQFVTNGNYTATVTASDDRGNIATNSVSITVNAMPVVSFVTPTNLQTYLAVTNVTLSVSASDSDGTITNVQFFYTNSLLGTLTSIGTGGYYNLTWSNRLAAYYPITAVATDNHGASSVSSIRVFKVLPTNAPPTVAITYPTNNAVFANCPDITLTAVATNGSGTVTNVEFFVNGQSIGSVADAPYSLNQCCWKPGTYTITAMATDSLGTSCVSTNVQITISPELPAERGFWDPTFHTPNVYYGSDETDECGNSNLFLVLCQSASVYGTNLYLAGGEDPGSDFASPSLYKYDGTSWFHWGGGVSQRCQTNTPFGLGLQDSPSGVGGVAVNDSGIYVAGYDESLDEASFSDFSYAVWELNGTNWTQLGDYFGEVGFQFPFDSQRNYELVFWPNYQPRVQFIGSDLYIFGNFIYDTVDTNIQYIAKWDAVSNVWRQVGTPLNAPVWAVANWKGNLIIGGAFTDAGGNTNANHVAELIGGSWTNLGEGVGGVDHYDGAHVGEPSIVTNVDSEVFSLAVNDTHLFVGGDFTYAGNQANANGIAVWDGAHWEAIGGGLASHPDSIYGVMPGVVVGFENPRVYTISTHCDTIYVGGAFNDAINADGTDVPAASIASATWDENSQQWSWSDMDIGVYDSYYISLDVLIPATVLTTAIQEDPVSGAYDVIVGGFTDLENQYVGSAQNFFPALSRWRVGYPQPRSLPKVAIVNPVNQTIITNGPVSPANIVITSTASSSYTNIGFVEFFINGQLSDIEDDRSCSCNDVTNSYSWSTNQNGVYLLTAVAIDAGNLQKASTSVLVDLKSLTNSITAVDDQYTIPPGILTMKLQVLTNDSPASGLKISQITQLDHNLATINISHDGTYLTYTPLPNVFGADIFYYTVTNASGAVDSASVTVNILAPPQVIIDSPLDQERHPVASPLTIMGTASALGSGNTVTNVRLFSISASGVTATNQAPVAGVFNFNWTSSTPGWYTFIAAAADANGTTNVSEPVTISLFNSNAPAHTITAAISNLTSIDNSQNGLSVQIDPVITQGVFDLRGQAEDSIATNAVSYKVMLYQPNSGVASYSSDLNLQAALYATSPPFADVTPVPLNAQGFHIGGDTNGDLGLLNLTGVPNGIYELVFQVRGGTDVTNMMVEIQLNSQLKIGQFSFSEQDVVLPVSGIPITVTRTYNSLNPLSGDFGYSWSYALNSMDVQLDDQREDVTVGGDSAPWADDEEGDNGLPKVVNIRTGGGWDVTLTLPDGRRVTFAFIPRYTDSGDTYAEWKAPPGVVGVTLTPEVSGSDLLTAYPFLHWADSDLSFGNAPIENQDFPGWILTTQDGTTYHITRGTPNNVVMQTPNNPGQFLNVRAYGPPKLTSIVQRSGDTIVISDSSIYHQGTNGVINRSVSFIRDTQNRITAVYDPNTGTNGPPTIQYVYNQDTGNLIQVIKLVDSATGSYVTNKYHYDNASFPHYITSIENADGVPVAQNFYDDSGKLTAVQDADGNLTQFIHNTANNVDVVIDRLGHTNTYVYDLNGNVTAQTNALGQVTTMAYDGNNNKTNEVTYLNGQPYATNSTVYDPTLNLPLVTTDPLGHTNSFSYDQYGDLLTNTDARGFSSANIYDGNGNLIGTTDALNNSTANSYSGGLLVGSSDAAGTITTNYYDPSENLIGTATLAADGVTILSTNTFGYDDNGNRTNSTVWRKAGGSWTPATTIYIYDALNRVTQTVDPDGGTNTVVYDNIGKQQATIDKLGHTTSYTYDAQGRLIQTAYPDGTTESSGYDAAGNRTSSVDRNGNSTTYVYDALNRLTQTIYPDNTTNTTVYDGVGRMAQTMDARGIITGFDYDPAGRRLAVTNAFGINGIQNISSYGYDANGNQTTFTDANNHTTTTIFDALNRQVQMQYPDSTKTSTGYDADGRRVAETNQDGIVTLFGNDGAGRLISVTNALSQVTRYQYDEAGNEIAQVDALNRTNTYTYDGMGRRISHTMPGGQSEGFAYDLAGNLTYQTNFSNVIITNQFDAMNRLTNCVSVNGYRVSYTYTLTGQRATMTDVSSTNSYSYDNRDRLQLKTVHWTGGPTVSLNYGYDANGNVTNLWSSTANGVTNVYQYDVLNRLTNVLANGNAAASYGFDMVGNLQAMRYGNGVTNLYQYDALNRLTNSVWKLNTSTLASFYSQIGLTGNRTNLSESVNGSSRGYSWRYDALYRLTNETVSTTAPTGTLSYGYDAVGNRTNRSGSLGSLGSQTPTYNTNDWLSSDTYDNNGNTTNSGGNFYRYDAMNHLTNANNTIFITYDGDGNRVSKTNTVTGIKTYYLLDDRNPSGYVQVLEEYQGSSLSNVYNYGLALINQRQLGVSTNYFSFDGHGSTRMLTDAGGGFINAFAYDAFGTLIASNGTPQTAYLYCGQQFDPDLGLYYNRARYLNPDTGRFWTMDSFSGNSEDPLSLHKYLYGADNPVDRIDPSGHDGELISTMAAVGTVGILAAETAGPTIEAEGAAEVEIIEAETAEQVSMAQAELQQAFQSSGAAVGRAFQTFGRLAENTARNTINMALRNADVEIEENPAAAQNGTRYLDFALKQGSKYLKMEVKYNLPKSGAQLSRLAAQVNESVNAADGGTTVVWSLRAPPPATVQAVQQALGANYSKVVFKSGIGDLLTYLKTVF